MIFCKSEYLLKRHFPNVFEPLLKRPQLGYLSWYGHSAWPEELDGLIRISLFSSVQLFSHVQLFATPWTAAHQASLSITNSQRLCRLMSIESVMPSNHLILCCPLLLLPSVFPSIRAFSNELVLCIRWQKYWSFSFSISPFNEYSRLISFRMDWFDLLAVQGTLESSPTPQFKSVISSPLSFLYGPTLTSTHDYWKNQSFDLMDLYWQSNVSAFSYAV